MSDDRKLRSALRAARKSIASTRRTIFESHCERGKTKRVVTNEAALAWMAELDGVIAMIDDALASEVGK